MRTVNVRFCPLVYYEIIEIETVIVVVLTTIITVRTPGVVSTSELQYSHKFGF